MIEVLTIGTELLLGATVDTNAAWLAVRFAAAGYPVTQHTTVGDDPDAITGALRAALDRTACVVCTGGLGPTPDDLTRDAAAALYGAPLELDPAWLAVIEDRFRRRGMVMPANNRQQAMLPRGAVLLANPLGTAPGLALHDPTLGTAVLLPGVPGEMRRLVEDQVVPYLHTRLGPGRVVRSRTLRTTGLAESALAEMVGDVLGHLPLALAYLPAGTGTDLRLTCRDAGGAGAADALLAEGVTRLQAVAGEWVYGEDRQDLAALVGERLRDRGWKLAVAESCTGGLLGSRITAIPGSSDYFVGGVIAYANATKQALLGVDAGTLSAHGAVSEAVARELAEGVARRTGAECSLAVTGVAGPDGGSADKPVGTVWTAACHPGGTEARLHRLGGTRTEIQARAAQGALAMLFRML